MPSDTKNHDSLRRELQNAIINDNQVLIKQCCSNLNISHFADSKSKERPILCFAAKCDNISVGSLQLLLTTFSADTFLLQVDPISGDNPLMVAIFCNRLNASCFDLLVDTLRRKNILKRSLEQREVISGRTIAAVMAAQTSRNDAQHIMKVFELLAECGVLQAQLEAVDEDGLSALPLAAGEKKIVKKNTDSDADLAKRRDTFKTMLVHADSTKMLKKAFDKEIISYLVRANFVSLKSADLKQDGGDIVRIWRNERKMFRDFYGRFPVSDRKYSCTIISSNSPSKASSELPPRENCSCAVQ